MNGSGTWMTCASRASKSSNGHTSCSFRCLGERWLRGETMYWATRQGVCLLPCHVHD